MPLSLALSKTKNKRIIFTLKVLEIPALLTILLYAQYFFPSPSYLNEAKRCKNFDTDVNLDV